MSIVVDLNNADFSLSSGVNLAYVNVSKVAGTYNHKVLLELTYVDYGATSPSTKTISFANSLDNSDNVLFDLTTIYETIVTPMIASAKGLDDDGFALMETIGSIHNMPNEITATTPLFCRSNLEFSGYSSFRGNGNYLTLKFYEMNSSTATGTPVKDASTEVVKNVFLMYGRANDDDPVQIEWTDYKLTGNTKKLLNSNYYEINGQPNIDIRLNDFHTCAFFNMCNVNQGARPQKLVFNYFNGSTQLGQLEALNLSGSGGGYDSDPTATGLQSTLFILHFGCGLENLQRLDMTESEYSGTKPDDVSGGRSAITHYTMKVVQVSTPSDLEKSKTYKFNIKNYCDRYEQTRLAFLNRFGVWEYYTFNKAKTSELKVEKQTMDMSKFTRQPNFGSVGGFLNSAYSPDLAKQGTRITSMNYDETFTLFTDYLEDYELEIMKDIMMSPQIHMLEGTTAKALILDNTSMTLKGEKETGLYKYEFKFKYALPKHKSILG